MKDKSGKFKLHKHWIIFSLFMLLMIYPIHHFIGAIKDQNINQLTQLTNLEIHQLGNIVETLLQSGQYDAVQSVFDEWSVSNTDIDIISLTTANGYRIGEYNSRRDSTYTISDDLVIKYGYSGFATLNLTKNIEWIYQQHDKNRYLFMIGWLVLGLAGLYIIRNFQIHQYENQHLRQLQNELESTNEKLQKEQSFLRSLIDSIPDPIFFKDKNSVYLGCNKAFTKFSGRSEQEQIGKSDLDLFDFETANKYRSIDLKMLESGKADRFEEWVTYPDGRKVLLDTLKTPYFDQDGNILGFIGISRDITDIKNFQDKLEELAYHDSLTGLPNRRLLMDRLHLAITHSNRYQKKLAICSIDLDGFKPINDEFGHDAGDKVLIEFSNRLSNALRAGDMVARWGGDEFTLLFAELANINECIELVERLQHLILVPIKVEEKTFNLTASMGLTIYPDDKTDDDTLLRHADLAMYDAKIAGKNTYKFFDLEQDRLLHDHHQNRQRIEEALEQEEFILYFQPQIHLKQGAPYGVEALVRWNHPQQGILPPATFLPYIEGNVTSIDLDWWVIEKSISQLEDWLHQGVFFHLSINVSAITFQQKDFVEKLRTIFVKHPVIQPEMISLELLETAALGNLEYVAEKMIECKTMGLQFSLDDFGTGYSSLTYLNRLPADVLKIDQSFVRDMLVDEKDMNIVEGIIRLSSAFNRMVIAEGVEGIEHGTRLIELGCLFAQGYAIAKPMPANEIRNWLNGFKAPTEWLEAAKPSLTIIEGNSNAITHSINH
jgi:diguanylate cyclase (GGDEF)-like protein/PAS domain S-box-containing protein